MMWHSESFIPCLDIHLSHGYYSTAAPADLVPDKDSATFFRKQGWIFRKREANRWMLLRSSESAHEDFALTFDVVPTDPLFHYVTERADTEGGELERIGQNGTWALLTATSKPDAVTTVRILFLPPEKQLEFILVPRHTDTSAVIGLREVRNRVEFLPPEKFPGIPGAWRVAGKDKTALREDAGYRFQLWEKRDSGERLLADGIPPPRPDESSPVNSHHSITTYFYY